MLLNRCVVLGVTGGIAAYKSVYLASELKKKGADVHVIMTKNAMKFVAPLTFETVTGNRAITDTFERVDTFEVEHVELAKKADIFIVAPATANFIAKAAGGVADDMLTTTFLAAKCVKVIAPSMNTQMYEDDSLVRNVDTLINSGLYVMETDEGSLACGDAGSGRMKEPGEIIEYALNAYAEYHDMAGIRVLVTAGPTREYIDPVRFLSNPSTGKMGYEIAREAALRGAYVTLVSGPVDITAPQKVLLIKVTSAEEMYIECVSRFDDADIVIKTAAVSDYRPKEVSEHKLKKGEDITLELTRTRDILKELGERKVSQVLVGFAAETDNLAEYARHKLTLKNADMICANDVTEPDSGFGSDYNHLIIFTKDGKPEDLGTLSKTECAQAVVDRALMLFNSRD